MVANMANAQQSHLASPQMISVEARDEFNARHFSEGSNVEASNATPRDSVGEAMQHQEKKMKVSQRYGNR